MKCSLCDKKMQKAVRGPNTYYVCEKCDCIRVVKEKTT